MSAVRFVEREVAVLIWMRRTDSGGARDARERRRKNLIGEARPYGNVDWPEPESPGDVWL